MKQSKMRIFIFLMLFLYIFGTFISIRNAEINSSKRISVKTQVILNDSSLNPFKPLHSIKGIATYTEITNITINSDSDLGAISSSGNGDVDNPYIIKNYNITNSTQKLINIQDTTKYFILTDNLLNGITGNNDGIWLNNVTHGTIMNNSIHKLRDGIFLENTYNITIYNNTIFNNSIFGIELSSSTNTTKVLNNDIYNNTAHGISLFDSVVNTIAGNKIYDNIIGTGGSGIELTNSNTSIIANNTIHNNDLHGIKVLSSSFNNTVINNTVYENDNDGIQIYNSTKINVTDNTVYKNKNDGIRITVLSSDTIVSDNTVYDNTHNGIQLWTVNSNIVDINTIFANGYRGFRVEHTSNSNFTSNAVYSNDEDGFFLWNSTTNIISSNTFYNNFWAGIRIEGSSNNSIKGNNFIENTNTEAYDDSLNNGFSDNYWHGWTSPDTNSDGIVDNAYIMSGSAGNSDPSPRVSYYTPVTIHILARPTVSYPNGGETLTGSVTIQWSAATDFSGHGITYGISYSSDGGSSWNTVTTDITSLSYDWDTSTYANGSNYQIKVTATCTSALTSEDMSNAIFFVENVVTVSDTSTTDPAKSTPFPTEIIVISVTIGFLAIVGAGGLIGLRRVSRTGRETLLKKIGTTDYELAKKVQEAGFPDLQTHNRAAMEGYNTMDGWNVKEKRKNILLRLLETGTTLPSSQLMRQLNFTDERRFIEWCMQLPAENPFQLQGDLVIFRKTEFDSTTRKVINDLVRELDT